MTEAEEKKYVEYCEIIREYYQTDCSCSEGMEYYRRFREWLTNREDIELKEKAFLDVNIDDLECSKLEIDPEVRRKLIDDFVDILLNSSGNGDQEKRNDDTEQTPGLVKRRFFIPFWARVAAVVIPLVVVAGFWIVDNSLSPQIVSAPIENKVLTDRYYAENARNEELSLDDGTKITINSGSTLITVQDNNTRTAKLDGEGYFDVKKDIQRPFVVETQSLNIQVLGTKFNVEAYPDREFIVVTLEEGSIELNDIKGHSWVLTPNHQFVYNKTTNEGELFALENCYEALAWMKGLVVCKNMSTIEILNYLERKYDVKFIVDPGVKFNDTRRYSAKFDSHDTVSSVLDILLNVITDDLRYIEDGKTIRIMKK